METIVKEEKDGQLTFSINGDTSNFVVMSNNLAMGRQNLTLHEFKLVRLIIMQIVANDNDFREYEISPSEFARIIGNQDTCNAYHFANDVCKSLTRKSFEILSDDGSWVRYNWTSRAGYNAKKRKMFIKLNNDLKPLLLKLINAGYYTQYSFDNIAQMSSTYSGRIFEMIIANIRSKILPDKGTTVFLTKQQIVDGCMLYKQDDDGNILYDSVTKQPIEKYQRISQLKEKVIKKACREITNNTLYYVPFDSEDDDKSHGVEDIKEGKSIIGFKFYVNMIYHPNIPKPKENRIVKIIQD